VKCLLDTHALLWWLADDERLGPQSRALIANPANTILVSVVSLWELTVKRRIGKLSADIEEIASAADQQGFVPLSIQRPHLKTLAGLPMHDRDPFDHLLIAQAISEDAAFISSDRHAIQYSVKVVND
jgi:PIN domain nuclease of toxin-antitoxin system